MAIELMFLSLIAGMDAEIVEDYVNYAGEIRWFGEKIISLSLDKGKTILNRQTNLVLHNSKPQNKLDYHVRNAAQSIKKTNFILEEWPYDTLNKPLISKGTDDELAPWMRPRNRRQLNIYRPERSNRRPKSAFSTNGNGLLRGDWKQQQAQQQKQHQQQNQYQQHQYQQHQYQQHQYQQHQYQQRQYQQRQYQQHQYQQHQYQQHQNQQHKCQQFQYQPLNPHHYHPRNPHHYHPRNPHHYHPRNPQQYQYTQQEAFFFQTPPPPPLQQVFMYGQMQINPYLANFGFHQYPTHFY